MQSEEEKLVVTFSKFIRLSGADEHGYCQCYTCPNIFHWKQIDCGHFRKRKHQNTKYNLKNNKPQCRECNGHKDGMYEVFAENLDKEYGEGTAQNLVILSHMICKLSDYDYKEMNKDYKVKVKQLLKRL